MTLLVAALVLRYMKETSGFLPHDADGAPRIDLELSDQEEIVGYYMNPPPWEQYQLVFTSQAVWIVDGNRTERIALSDITDYESPGPSKQEASGLQVRTTDGSRFMRVAGAYGPEKKYKDYIAFMGVVRAVIRSGSMP